MIVALNVFCVALLAFDVISLGFFIYVWRHRALWSRLRTWILSCSGVMLVASFFIVAALAAANFLSSDGLDGVSLVTACIMLIGVIFSQAVLFGCMRDDLRERDYAILLSVYLYCAAAYASCEIVYTTCAFGFGMVPSFYPADILNNMVTYVAVLLIWHYVRVVGRGGSRAFRMATAANYVLAAIGCLAFVASPLTGMITVSPESLNTIYADWYLVAEVPLMLIEICVLVAAIRARLGRSEKVALVALMLCMVFSEWYISYNEGIYMTPMFLSIGGLMCYLGIVMRRAREVERHLVQVDMASDIQQGMLPQEFPEDERFSVDAHMWPAKEVAGDFFDFYQPDHDNLYITIADVSGKDVPAAMFMARAHALIREHEKAGLSPHEIFNKVNRSLAEGNSEKLFVTAWIGKINLSKGILTFANAGHNPPIITREGQGSEYVRTKVNLILGIRKRTQYKRQTMLLKRGDRILLYTDGVTESIDVNEEQFGENRLLDYVKTHQQLSNKEITTGLFDEVNNFAEGMEQFDDVTVLCGTYQGDAMTNATGYAEEIFPAERERLDEVNAFIEDAALGMGYPEDHVFKLEMCIEELFVNVCNYAYAASGEEGSVRVSVMATEGEVQILFADTGTPFNPLMQEAPNFEERARKKTVGGLGIHLVRKFMDDARYEYAEGENRLTIVKLKSGEN